MRTFTRGARPALDAAAALAGHGRTLSRRHRVAGLGPARPRVNAPGGADERQADRIADAVLSTAGSHRPVAAARGGGSSRRPSEPADGGVMQREAAPAGGDGVAAAAVDGGAAGSAAVDGGTATAVAVDGGTGGAAAGDGEADASAAVGAVARSGGQPLDAAARAFMEPRFGHDFGRVRVHADGAAATAARAVRARAYTVGRDIVFGAGEYAPATAEGRRLLAHELAHVVQQADAVGSGTPTALQRKEVSKASELAGPQDWTTADRESNTKRWQDACLTNLNAADSRQYVKIVERRDFYLWFYEYAAARGYQTRWALAAYVVANGAHQIADMDVSHDIANDTLGMAGVELQGVMREGNQVIFDNVLPKLKQLIDGGRLQGRAALDWDMRILAEEQTLIQPMYSRMSKETISQLDYIARKKRFAGLGARWTDEDKAGPGPPGRPGTVPGFDQPSMLSIKDRWMYGMNLGGIFSPLGVPFDPKRDAMPSVGAGYSSGAELAKVDTRANLHLLDAWLNPNRHTRMGPDSMAASTYLTTIIGNLTLPEKMVVLSDRSPDGWAYSTRFAQFSFIDQALVAKALPPPSTPMLASLVWTFMLRYHAERAAVQAKYPTPGIPFGP